MNIHAIFQGKVFLISHNARETQLHAKRESCPSVNVRAEFGETNRSDGAPRASEREQLYQCQACRTRRLQGEATGGKSGRGLRTQRIQGGLQQRAGGTRAEMEGTLHHAMPEAPPEELHGPFICPSLCFSSPFQDLP